MRRAKRLGLPNPTRQSLQGGVFEVRQGYKSKDSKRQNADVANARMLTLINIARSRVAFIAD